MNASPFHLRRLLLPAITAGVLVPSGIAAQNLLGNPSFETGVLSPWTVVAGNPSVTTYGTTNLPGPAVANTILGGNLLLRDSGNGAVEQLVTPASMPLGSSLVVDGYVGGGSEDEARLVVRFFNANSVQIGLHSTDYVTDAKRNFEAVLLYRRLVVPTPPGAVSFAVRVEFRDLGCCGGPRGAADNLSAELVMGPTLPPAWPLQAELLGNPGFEGGWLGHSPLTLVDPRGWEGVTGSCQVKPYSNSDPTVPSGLVSCRVGGAAPNPSCGAAAAGNLLAHTGNATLRQLIDLRGNTAQFVSGAVALRVAAVIGGVGSEPDTAQVDFSCLGANFQTLNSGIIGPIGAAERNFETALVHRELEIPVFPGTCYVDLRVTFADYTCCGGSRGLIDNISAMLVQPSSPPPVPLNVDLLSNGDFESGSLPGSPLELTNAMGWRGQGSNRAWAVSYGGGDTPSTAFAAARSLGTQVLRDGSNASLRQAVDLRGIAARIAGGTIAMQASAWLGGYLNEPDTAEVRVRFYDMFEVEVGALQVLPPVTAADRQNQTTMLQRVSAPFPVPTSAVVAVVAVVFSDTTCCGGSRGLADDIRLVAFDTTEQSSASPYPGTGGDFVLMTGVNELPRTGPGHYVNSAGVNDVVRMVVGSPNGTLDGSPMVLALNVIVTGAPPTPILPGLVIEPHNAIVLFNGFSGGLLAPTVVPLAQGGNVYNLPIPISATGFSILVQSLCLPWNGQQPPNGLFFASEGHEIRLQ